MALRAVAVTRRFERDGVVVDALRGINLTVPNGELLAVMGPSGCGKSTLLHLLGALDTPTSGSIEVDGRSLAGLSERDRTNLRRHRLGFVFQAFNLVPVLSARENVLLPGVIVGGSRAERERRADELLDSLGIGDLGDRLPGRLSGGQQQRVAVARGLFHNPAVLLADEPTGNLDRRSGLELLDALQASNDAGQTIVVVTHDPTVAARASRVVFLRDGLVADELAPTGASSVLDALDRLETEVDPVA